MWIFLRKTCVLYILFFGFANSDPQFANMELRIFQIDLTIGQSSDMAVAQVQLTFHLLIIKFIPQLSIQYLIFLI